MKIRRLHIVDFGLLRYQDMEEIDSGLVVIGGPNRAGKSTLMQALRYLCYGLKKSYPLPPPAQEYRVEAGLSLDDGTEVSVRLTGYAQPEFFLPGGEKLPASGVTGSIDDFSYRQIFTISLNELCNLPEGIGNDEAGRLQSVLLGAGLADAAAIPRIRDELKKTAEGIGGKNGTPQVRQFRELNKRIQEGLNLREEAVRQVEEFEKSREAVAGMEKEIARTETEISRAELAQTRLEVAKQYYREYRELQRLQAALDSPEARAILSFYPENLYEKACHLRDTFAAALEEYNRLRSDFHRGLGLQGGEYELILARAAELKAAGRQAAAVRQRIHDLLAGLSKIEKDRNRLRSDINDLNEKWEGSFEKIKSLPGDRLHVAEVGRKIKEYEEIKEELRRSRDKLAEYEKEAALTGNTLNALGRAGTLRYLPWLPLSFLAFAVIGYFLTLTAGLSGLLIGIGGMLGSGFYFLIRFLRERELRVERRNLEEKLTSINASIREKRKEVLALEKEFTSLVGELSEEQRVLELPGDDIPLLGEYCQRVQELKRRIEEWEEEKEELARRKRRILNELESLAGLVREAGYIVSLTGDPLAAGESVLTVVEESQQHLEYAEELRRAEKKLRETEEEICRVLEAGYGGVKPELTGTELLQVLEDFIRRGDSFKAYKKEMVEKEGLERLIAQAFTPRVCRAFSLDENGGKTSDCLTALGGFLAEFVSEEEIERSYEETGKRIQSLKKDLEALKEEKSKEEYRLKELAAPEKLEKAQSIIDEARGNLEPLARKFAVYNLAALLLDRLHQRFLDKTKDELLVKASQVFTELTEGEYRQILPPENLLTPDFRAVTAEGTELAGTALLSRGTREQLFLSVRLSRIKELKPAMPVILDDSLVNFDVNHARQAVKILTDLAGTHQVFILTCHPEIVEYIAERGKKAQYWRLNTGRIERAEAGELSRFLRGETLC